jgi:hypothetical protein
LVEAAVAAARLGQEVLRLQAGEGDVVGRVAVDARALLALTGALGDAEEGDVRAGRAAQRLRASRAGSGLK